MTKKVGINKKIMLFFVLLLIATHAKAQQLDQDSTLLDSTDRAISEEGALRYSVAFSYPFNPLIADCPKRTSLDTSIFGGYQQDISLKSKNIYAGLGVYGQASNAMNFSYNRPHGFSFKQNVYPHHLRTLSDWNMYDVKMAYAKLSYNFASGRSHLISADYAQKITEDLDFSLNLESVLGEGKYIRQQSKDVSAGTGFSYLLPSKRYGVKLYYNYNLIKVEENGGIVNDSDFKNKTSNTRSFDVNLLAAENTTQNHHVFLRHYLSISPKAQKEGKKDINIGYLVHDLDVNTFRYNYVDTDLDSANYQYFFSNIDTTNDTTRFLQVRNSLYWSSYRPEDTLNNKNYFFRFAAGASHTFNRVRYSLYTYSDNQITPFGLVHARLFKRLELKATAFFTVNGYNAGDITIDGILSLDMAKKPTTLHCLEAGVKFYNHSPDYIFSHYLSNNYRWQNDALKKQQTIVVEGFWKYQDYAIGVHYYTMNNYTVFDNNMNVKQYERFSNIYQLSVHSSLDIKGFGWHSNSYLQYCDNSEIHIPLVATRQIIYYGFNLFKKALLLQLGLDFQYNTSYYGNDYNPALQQFYVQSDTKIGNYGYLDFFLRAKIEKFIIQAKLTHLWAGLFGNTYFVSPHYPGQGLGFSVGIQMRFHD